MTPVGEALKVPTAPILLVDVVQGKSDTGYHTGAGCQSQSRVSKPEQGVKTRAGRQNWRGYQTRRRVPAEDERSTWMARPNTPPEGW